MAEPLEDRLKTLLASEREALKEGDFQKLAALLSEKEEIVELLANNHPDSTALKALKQDASRNEALLEAASRGIASVRDRIKMLREGGPPLKTYTADGRAHSITNQSNRTNRKA